MNSAPGETQPGKIILLKFRVFLSRGTPDTGHPRPAVAVLSYEPPMLGDIGNSPFASARQCSLWPEQIRTFITPVVQRNPDTKYRFYP